jgi:hypothetical protein
MTYFRLVRMPGIGCYLPAHWDEDSEGILVVPQFTRFADILELANILEQHGFNPFPIYTDAGEEIKDNANAPSAAYYDFIALIKEPEHSLEEIWASAEALSDDGEDYPIYQTLAEVIR